MGYTINTDLGPFIKVKTIIDIEEIERRTCDNHGVIHDDSIKFCSKCGLEIKSKIIKEEGYPHIEEIINNDDLYQYISNEGYTYYFDNAYGIGYKDPDENEMVIIDTKEIDLHIIEFTEKHKINIDMIQKHVEEQIKVEYGLFKHVW